jgi:hypothetical protein
MRKTIRKSLAWLTALSALASSPSWAVPAPGLDFQFTVGGNTETWSSPILSTTNGWTINDGSTDWGGSTLSWNHVTLNYDPFISASVNVVNNTAFTQTYTLTFTMRIGSPILGGSLIGGSVQGGITDSGTLGIGALSTAGPGTSMYNGLVDGITVLSLLSDVTTVPVRFAGDSNSTNTFAGLPGPTLPGPLNANTSIGIKHEFTLSAGDTATFSSFFQIEPVPEPACFSLLAMGALLVVRRRR